MAEQNKNSGGFINLKRIHEIQVGGAVQALIRDLRSTRIQLEHILVEANKVKKQQQTVVVKEEPKIEEPKQVVVVEKQPELKVDVEKKPERQFNNNQPRQFKQQERQNNQGQKPFNKPFGNQGQNQNQRQWQFNKDNRQFNSAKKPGTGFAASKGNNFRSFTAPDIVIPENNTRNYGNKNKSSTTTRNKTNYKK